MFLRLPFQPTHQAQHILLILNTVILITALIVVELVYAEVPKEKRQHLRYFYPLFAVLAVLLIFAVYKQARA